MPQRRTDSNWYLIVASPASRFLEERFFNGVTGTHFSGGPDFDAPLVTDRPDFTEASSTVGRGAQLFELGYTYTVDREDGMRNQSHSFPETLLRYGVLADWFEFRAALNYAEERTPFSASGGAEDLYLGAKIGLTPQECLLPEMAIIPQMWVPTGDDDDGRRSPARRELDLWMGA